MGVLFSISGCYTGNKVEGEKISVDMSKASKMNYQDWITGIEIIPLELKSQSVMAHCSKLEVFANRYYLYDAFQRNALVFDEKGKFLFNTKSISGNGPEECSSVMDFDIDKVSGNLELFDAVRKRIEVYDLNFKYIKSISLPLDLFHSSNFKHLSGDIYAFYSLYNTHIPSLRMFSATQGKIIEETAEVPKFANRLIITTSNPFSQSGNEVDFSHLFPNYALYGIDSKTYELNKRYEFDFGRFNYSLLDKAKENRSDEYYENISVKPPHSAVLPFSKVENQNSVFIGVWFRNKSYEIRYDKNTGKYIVEYDAPREKRQLLSPWHYIDNGYIYKVVDPQNVGSFVDPALLSPRSCKVLASLKPNDNEVIIRYKLK